MIKQDGRQWSMKQGHKKQGKKMKPRSRFRAAVRQVIAYREWLIDVDDDDSTGGNNLAKMNQILLRSKKKQAQGMLTLMDKSILMKDADMRTEEEIRRICYVIGGLKCFKRYSEEVQRKLAASVYFVYYGPNRVVIRQGHTPRALYFLLVGEVAVTINTTDPATGLTVAKDVGHLGNGEMFGEVSLIHEISRTATVTTLANCSLLLLKRHDFEDILKVAMIEEWEESRRVIRKIPYFDDWSPLSIRECCILSKIQNYEPNEIILGDGYGQSAYVYYVIEGQCQLVEALRLVVSQASDGKHYRLHNEGSAIKIAESLETFFLEVCRMKTGACFNIGEFLGSRTMVAATKVQCLMCPLYWILQNNYANIWNRIIAYLDSSVPTTKEIFLDFLEERRWMRYKHKLVQEIVDKHPRSNKTSIHDVPYSLRMSNVQVHDHPGYVRKAKKAIKTTNRKPTMDETEI